MPRYEADYEKKLIALRRGDVDSLRRHFPDVAYNGIIRSLVSQFVDALENGQKTNIEFNPNKIEIK